MTLKKDEIAKYSLAFDDKKYDLIFRWTLFINEGLVMLYKYQGFPYQNILYAKYHLDSFKINLLNRAANASDEPYVLVIFKSFDKKTKTASFEVAIWDDKRTVPVQKLLPK